MTTQEIVAKLWNLCNVLRDDGITYHQYVTELTYILFLKMAKETDTEAAIPEDCRWEALRGLRGLDLKNHYKKVLDKLGTETQGRVREIYAGAATNIDEPKNLEKIITSIDELDWFSAKEEGLGSLYEGLLEKNANEKKSGAGQYFTPRVLIDVMTHLIKPQPGERCNDSACGTSGFLVAASDYLKENRKEEVFFNKENREHYMNHMFHGFDMDRTMLRSGGSFGAKVWHSTDKYRRVIYRCNNKYDGHKCQTPHVTEDEVKAAFVTAFNKLVTEREEVIANARLVQKTLCATEELEQEKSALAEELAVVVKMVEECVAENARIAQNQAEYQKRYNRLVARYDAAKRRFDEVMETIAERSAKAERLAGFAKTLEGQGEPLTEFDE